MNPFSGNLSSWNWQKGKKTKKKIAWEYWWATNWNFPSVLRKKKFDTNTCHLRGCENCQEFIFKTRGQMACPKKRGNINNIILNSEHLGVVLVWKIFHFPLKGNAKLTQKQSILFTIHCKWQYVYNSFSSYHLINNNQPYGLHITWLYVWSSVW